MASTASAFIVARRRKRSAEGVFVSALVANANLPVEDEGRLNDARLRENFISRVFTYHRFRTLVEAGHARDLMAFHGGINTFATLMRRH